MKRRFSLLALALASSALAAPVAFVPDGREGWSIPDMGAGVAAAGRGGRIVLAGPGFSGSLELTRAGRAGALVPSPAQRSAGGARAWSWRRGALTEEWTVVPGGLEQTVVLDERPAGAADELVLELSVDGFLASPSASGRSVLLKSPAGAPALRLSHLVAWDATGRTLPSRFAFGPGAVKLVVNDAGAAYPVTVDPVVRSATWTADGPAAGGLFGRSVATAGDVNADGWPDLVVGARGTDVGTSLDAGAVHLFLGSADGYEPEPSWSAEGDAANALLGAVAGTAGDVNGDGYSDFFASAPGAGRVDVWLGSAAGPSTRLVLTVGSTEGGFGSAVSAAGDVDGDGHDDLVVGEPGKDTQHLTDAGRILIFRGGSAGPDSYADDLVVGAQSQARFGAAVAGGLDVNADGYDDVLAGSPFHDDGDDDEGMVQLFLGSASGLTSTPAWRLAGDDAGANLGAVVALAGDVDGDGFVDLAVGAPRAAGGEGRAVVVRGTATGARSTAWALIAGAPGELAGFSLACAGDVDGDGRADVAVGGPGFDGAAGVDSGRVRVFAARDGSLELLSEVEGTQGGAELGIAVGPAGDVDGDGFGDLAAGAWYHDAGLRWGQGRVAVVPGSWSGIDTTPAWSHPDHATMTAAAGDVNGDGLADLVVGTRWSSRAQVHSGATTLGARQALGSRTMSGGVYDRGWASRAGDVNGDGFDDLVACSPFGALVLARGSASGLGDNLAHLVPSHAASLVEAAGDVNGDGFGDVVMGNANGSLSRVSVLLGGSSALPIDVGWSTAATASVRSLAGPADFDGDGYSDLAFLSDRVRLAFGGPAGIEAELVLEDSTLTFPSSVAAAGDVNGDGMTDLLVAEEDHTESGLWQRGRVSLYLGTSSGLEPAPAWRLLGEVYSMRLGGAVAGAGDVNADGFSDVLVKSGWPQGAVSLYLGSASGLAPQPANVLRIQHATGVGDTNGDGFDDIFGQLYDGNAGLFSGTSAGVADRRLVLRRMDGTVRTAQDAISRLHGARAEARAILPLGRGGVALEWQATRAGETWASGLRGVAPRLEAVPTPALELTADTGPLPALGEWRFRVRAVGRGVIPWTSPWVEPPATFDGAPAFRAVENRAPSCEVSIVQVTAGVFQVRASAVDPDGDAVDSSLDLTECAGGVVRQQPSGVDITFIDGCGDTCTVSLTATDTQGAVSECAETLSWTPVSANAGADAVIRCADLGVTLTGRNERPGRHAVTARWEPADLVSHPDALATTTWTPGTYTLTLTEVVTGCTSTDEVVVTDEGVPFTVSAPPTVEISCETGVAQLSVTVDPPGDYDYRWTPVTFVNGWNTERPTTRHARTLWVTVTQRATGCQKTASVTVIDPVQSGPSDLVARPEAQPLTVSKAAGGMLALEWEDVAASGYNLYSGTLGSLRASRAYDHSTSGQCELPDPRAVIPTPPLDSYHLVASRCSGGDSSLGRDSFGSERPLALAPCP